MDVETFERELRDFFEWCKKDNFVYSQIMNFTRQNGICFSSSHIIQIEHIKGRIRVMWGIGGTFTTLEYFLDFELIKMSLKCRLITLALSKFDNIQKRLKKLREEEMGIKEEMSNLHKVILIYNNSE